MFKNIKKSTRKEEIEKHRKMINQNKTGQKPT
jgi:hypothetical protein